MENFEGDTWDVLLCLDQDKEYVQCISKLCAVFGNCYTQFLTKEYTMNACAVLHVDFVFNKAVCL